MKKLNASGLRDTLENLVLNSKIPLLGICVGMQMLAE
jgi:glutamine amidotransferase